MFFISTRSEISRMDCSRSRGSCSLLRCALSSPWLPEPECGGVQARQFRYGAYGQPLVCPKALWPPGITLPFESAAVAVSQGGRKKYQYTLGEYIFFLTSPFLSLHGAAKPLSISWEILGLKRVEFLTFKLLEGL